MTPAGSHSAPLTPEDTAIVTSRQGPGDELIRSFMLAFDLTAHDAGDAIDGLLMRVWMQTRCAGTRRHAMLAGPFIDSD